MLRWLSGATGLLFGFGLLASGASGETLEQALAKAYLNNPTLLAQRARLRATDELVSQALSNWRPELTFTGEVGKQGATTESAFFTSRENRTPQDYSLTLTQPLFRGGRTVAETGQAESLVRADRAQLSATEQDVLFDGVTAYMDVLRDQAVVELSINNERVVRRQLEATGDRFAVGEVTRTDLSQAEARLSQAIADRIRAEGDLISTRGTYKRVIGELPRDLSWPELAPGLPEGEGRALDIAQSAHPRIQAARFAEQAARKEVGTVTGELLPELNLNASLRRAEDRATRDSLAKSATLTAQITVPLYQAGEVSSRVREARERAGQRRIEVDETTREILEEVTRAWEALMTAKAQIEAFSDQVRANEVALEGVEQEALVGLRTVLDVLDAEQELFGSRVNLVRARRDEAVASYRLKSAIGQLTAQRLGLPVEAYDVERHYQDVRGKLFGIGID